MGLCNMAFLYPSLYGSAIILYCRKFGSEECQVSGKIITGMNWLLMLLVKSINLLAT